MGNLKGLAVKFLHRFLYYYIYIYVSGERERERERERVVSCCSFDFVFFPSVCMYVYVPKDV